MKHGNAQIYFYMGFFICKLNDGNNTWQCMYTLALDKYKPTLTFLHYQISWAY